MRIQAGIDNGCVAGSLGLLTAHELHHEEPCVPVGSSSGPPASRGPQGGFSISIALAVPWLS